MNLKRILLCCAAAALLSAPSARAVADDAAIDTAAPVQAEQYPGSNLPLLGDAVKALTLIRSGDIAMSAGKVHDAQSFYADALVASPGIQSATLGLARCNVLQGDFASAVGYYRSAINGRNEDKNINLLSEYALALSQAGYRQDAVTVYNHVVDLCKSGYSVAPMPVLPSTFQKNGSDYQPARMQGMLHLIRAMNTSTSDEKRIQSEIDQAADLAPSSPLVPYYKGTLLISKDRDGAKKLFQRALRLDDGSHTEAINKAMTP